MSFIGTIQANIDDFQKNLDKAQARMDTFSDSIGQKISKIGSKFQMIGGALSIGVTAPIVAAGTAAFKMAADFEDALGATDQIFKAASESTQQWANSLPTYFGIAEKEALEYSNMMGSMLVNIGNLTETEASRQSAKLIELAGDLTAMYGGTTQDAVRALTGALKGNNTMLDNYGMAASDALVKAKALFMGLVEQGKEMSLAAKQAATLALIYEQSAAAQGQAAREADGASGSIRAFKTEITNLTTEIGSYLLPIITPVVTKLKEIISRFRTLSPEAQKVIVVVAGIAAAIGPLLLGLGAILKLAPLVGTAFAAMTGPVGIAVTVITAAAAAIYHYWDDIKKVVLNTIAAIQQGISKFFNAASRWADALGFDGMSKSLKDLGGEFQYFSNNTQQEANEIGTEIKKTADETDKAAVSVTNLNTSFDGLSGSIAKSKVAQTDYRKELDNTLASWGIYDAQIKVLSDSYKKLNEDAVKAKATQEEFQTIMSKQWVDKALLNFENIGKDAFKNSKLTDITEGLSVPISINPILNNGEYDKVKSKLQDDLIEIGGVLSSSISDMMSNIGNSLANGENILGAIGKSILSSLGGFMKSIGEQMIALGTAGIAVKSFISNPFLSIAAGAALVALGSLASASMNRQAQNIGSPSSGYTSSINSTQNALPRGAYYNNDRQVVELQLKNGNLVGSFKYAEQKKSKLS